MNLTSLSALLGFFFVFTWIAFSFGDAVLCLLGALLFAAVAAVLRGDVDLADVQARAQEMTR